jgi:NCAIR mutase (PurE)-related protein
VYSLDLRRILEYVAKGVITVDEALKEVRLFALEQIENSIRFDIGRELRRDVPEIIFGEGKSVEELLKLVTAATPKIGRVIVSRLRKDHVEVLKNLGAEGFSVEVNERGRIAVIRVRNYEKPVYNCKVGVVTAGTADIGVAEEARTIVEEMGCRTIALYDVGIAGFQRVLEAVKTLKKEDVDVVIVVAGMEGALPSVIAALLDIPVIGVPTSVGYGAGGGGMAALYSMLQACPLGLAVVNIDNGVNAGIVAGLIGRRIAFYKQR